jgi:GT2 family glycosyltransferase
VTRVVHEIHELSIVIVNWNCGELLRRCVEKIFEHPPRVSFKIIVVDNASSDDSLASLTTFDPQRLRIFRNHENVGFGPANNQAFRLTKSPAILLLNPDTEVCPGAIDTLLASLSSNARIGVCGPRILNTDGSVQTSVWHNPARAWQILLSNLNLYLLLPRRLRGELLLGGHWAHDRRRVVPMLSGAALMLRREVIDDVGGFDERFEMYVEDNEWCYRVSRAGWQLLFEPAATVTHHGGQSSKKRWTNIEKLKVKLEAENLFEQLSLPRRRVIANCLTRYVVTSLQKFWRDLRGTSLPELAVIKRQHWKHLTQTFKSDQPAASPRVSKARADADNLA